MPRTAAGFPGRNSSKVMLHSALHTSISRGFLADRSRPLQTSKTAAPGVQHSFRSPRYSFPLLLSLPFALTPRDRSGFATCMTVPLAHLSRQSAGCGAANFLTDFCLTICPQTDLACQAAALPGPAPSPCRARTSPRATGTTGSTSTTPKKTPPKSRSCA